MPPETFPSSVGGATSTWDDASAAIRAWIMAGTGFDADHVIYDAQNGGRPSDPYAVIAIDGPYEDGQSETRFQDVEGTPTVGEEVAEVVTVDQYIEIRIQVFTKPTIGDSSARALLERCQNRVWLGSVRAAFAVAYMAPVEMQKVISVPAVLQTKFEGRASMLCRFRTKGLQYAFTTYISGGDVAASLTDSDIGDTFNVPL